MSISRRLFFYTVSERTVMRRVRAKKLVKKINLKRYSHFNFSYKKIQTEKINKDNCLIEFH